MKVGVYIPSDDREHLDALMAMADGITATGDQPEYVLLQEFDSPRFDAAVVFGVRKHAVPKSEARGNVFDAYREAGKPVLVLEKGYIKRDQYYAAGWNGLNGRADFVNTDVPGDRWDALGIAMDPYRETTRDNPILIAGQVPWDASVQHSRHLEWIASTIKKIQYVSNREIVVRPHPLAKKFTPVFLGTKTSDATLAEDLERAHTVVTYNSNTAVDATLAGVPVFAADWGSMVWDLANTDLNQINEPDKPDRMRWAHRIAYAQWTLDEMQDGLAWKHLRPMAETALSKAG